MTFRTAVLWVSLARPWVLQPGLQEAFTDVYLALVHPAVCCTMPGFAVVRLQCPGFLNCTCRLLALSQVWVRAGERLFPRLQQLQIWLAARLRP